MHNNIALNYAKQNTKELQEFKKSISFLKEIHYCDRRFKLTSSDIDRSSWAPVAHICNSSYSGGRDQEDPGSKPTWANSS
jgi:hypothetical protein